MLIHHYIELKKLVQELQIEIEKIDRTGSYEAGTRARWKLQEIRSTAYELRKKIQTQRKLKSLIKKQNKKNINKT